MIADLIVDRLRDLDADVDIDRVLDVLYLATKMCAGQESSTSDDEKADSAGRPEPVPFHLRDGVHGLPKPDQRVTFRVRSKPLGTTAQDGGGPLIADELRRPLAVGRALRPLRYRRPAPVPTELDEEATADLSAQARGRGWLPVLRAPMQRWADVAVLADIRSDIWNPRLAHVNLVLRRLGGFRQHREWRLRPPAGDRRHATVSPGLLGDRGPERNADRLIDPTGRRLLLVVTDGAGDGWSSGAYRNLFTRWAKTNPVGVISLVAPRLWPTPGMRAISRPVSVHSAWLPNGRWHAPGPAGPPIPITDLNPVRLGPFASVFVGASAGADTELLTLAPMGATTQPARPPQDPAEAVRWVRSRLRPRAFWLLVGLAGAPLLAGPLLDRARSMSAPDATVDDLAEVVQSGLVKPVVRARDHDGRELGYQFVDSSVRDELALWSDPAQRSLLSWDLVRYAGRVLGMSEVDAQKLVANPDSADALRRATDDGHADAGANTRRPSVVPPHTIDSSAGDYRRWVIQAVQRARRVHAVGEIATQLAGAGRLRSDEAQIVPATQLLDPARRVELFGRTDRLLAVDDLDALHNRSDPWRRRALDHLVATMDAEDGPVVALCGDQGHLAPIFEVYPPLRGLVVHMELPDMPADRLFTLVDGRIRARGLRWDTGVRQSAWRALCARYPQTGDSGLEVWDLAIGLFNQLIERWQTHSDGDVGQPVTFEDLRVVTETDVP